MIQTAARRGILVVAPTIVVGEILLGFGSLEWMTPSLSGGSSCLVAGQARGLPALVLGGILIALSSVLVALLAFDRERTPSVFPERKPTSEPWLERWQLEDGLSVAGLPLLPFSYFPFIAALASTSPGSCTAAIGLAGIQMLAVVAGSGLLMILGGYTVSWSIEARRDRDNRPLLLHKDSRSMWPIISSMLGKPQEAEHQPEIPRPSRHLRGRVAFWGKRTVLGTVGGGFWAIELLLVATLLGTLAHTVHPWILDWTTLLIYCLMWTATAVLMTFAVRAKWPRRRPPQVEPNASVGDVKTR